jgi:hypothetical protein
MLRYFFYYFNNLLSSGIVKNQITFFRSAGELAENFTSIFLKRK